MTNALHATHTHTHTASLIYQWFPPQALRFRLGLPRLALNRYLPGFFFQHDGQCKGILNIVESYVATPTPVVQLPMGDASNPPALSCCARLDQLTICAANESRAKYRLS